MLNIQLELERLRFSLQARGLSEDTINTTVAKAEQEITSALRQEMNSAMESAIQSGVEKRSAEFINELRPSWDAFVLETESSITDFSEPPMPMLDRLLASGAKPMADGSGVYKIIPIGSSGKPRPPIHTNIFDAQKAIMAERYESAAKQYNKVAPSGSQFRTATSKQSRSSAWVQPAKHKDFGEELGNINSGLATSHDDIVRSIIQNYEET